MTERERRRKEKREWMVWAEEHAANVEIRDIQ